MSLASRGSCYSGFHASGSGLTPTFDPNRTVPQIMRGRTGLGSVGTSDIRPGRKGFEVSEQERGRYGGGTARKKALHAREAAKP